MHGIGRMTSATPVLLERCLAFAQAVWLHVIMFCHVCKMRFETAVAFGSEQRASPPFLIGPQGPSARLFEGPARPMSSIGQSCGADPRLLGRESLDVRHLQPKSQRQERTTGA